MVSKNSQVFIVKTSPKMVLEDYTKLMHLANYENYYSKTKKTILKLNLSWSKFFPACSSPPWQVEGVLKTMVDDGFNPKNLFTAENRTVVTNIEKGLRGNKWAPIIKKYGVWFIPLTRIPYVPYESLRSKFLTLKNKSLFVLDSKIFPDGFFIPKFYLNKPIIHLPTMKTHGHTGAMGGSLKETKENMKHGGITCAMKNAFGGLLTKRRHFSHQYMSEVLVDLLIIQKQIHPQIFSVVDGTVCGDGAGPRTMIPRIKNYILAGYDQVAVDTAVAHMLGFNPIELPAIKLAHDEGLGCGDFDQIEIIGEDISNVNWNFKVKRSIVIWGDQMVRKGPLQFLYPLFRNELFFLGPTFASMIYHDMFWYPLIGKKRIKKFSQTEWGKKFKDYPTK
ncbi:hypothetical protein LCGC14_0680570 [marine sediment metagenome]|uniref:DUF362 domain-containing protein n=1 Tax=marine sediment metagenome TaxID=412755 RepID=A0A0F9QT98_9ZZZZ|nr:MAG: hypothetical protein Lokiarch_07430 [Candidatus Lokiarchaeum sp. GC14_75]